MKKVNYIISYLLVVCFLISVLTISSTLALHTKTTYNFHFNDGVAFSKINSPVEPHKLSSGVTKYFVSTSKKDFQIYEVNGRFRDPIFDKKEQRIMKKVKIIFSIELLASALTAVVFFVLYKYLYSNGFKEALNNRMRFAIYLTSGCAVVRILAFSIKSFRHNLYMQMVGIKVDKHSLLIPIFGDQFYKSYLLFSTIIVIVLIVIAIYFKNKMTKPNRLFS